MYTYLIWLMAHKLICTLAQRKAKPIRQVWVLQLFLGKAKTPISISFNCPWFCGRLTGVPLWVECGYYESSRGIGALWSLVWRIALWSEHKLTLLCAFYPHCNLVVTADPCCFQWEVWRKLSFKLSFSIKVVLCSHINML